jgi:pimeloyl-ACP methyl ester carboxylesterase
MKSLIFAFVPLLVLGCGNGSNNNTPDMAMAPTTLGTPPALAIACTDKVGDVYTLPTGLPTMDNSHRGDVFHCAPSESMTAAKVNAQINAYNAAPVTGLTAGYAEAGNVTSGFWTFRVAYRSLRNTPKVGGTPVEGDMGAVVAIPEHPIAGAPLVVWSHGSLGIAPKCAPSHLDLSGAVDDQDFPINMYKLAGYGYTVIAPDYAGFSFDQGPPGYFNAEDEAHGVLDATRAAAKLLVSPPDKVVIVGHSQGGHAALSAQSYAKSYGMTGTLAGVAVFAPLETSMAIWAAGTTDAAMLTTNDTSSVLYVMEYGYTAGALRGDTGGGLAIFQTAKQQAAKDAMLGGECYDAAKVKALGNKPSDFFDADYVNNVGFACAANPIGYDCSMAPSTPAGDAPLWLSRWKEDRPALDDQSAPILVFYGGMDTSVTQGRAQCARDKFGKDLMATTATTTIKYCFDAAANHRDIIRGANSDYVNQWIAARGGVGSDPTTGCTDFPTGVTCQVPPNDL